MYKKIANFATVMTKIRLFSTFIGFLFTIVSHGSEMFGTCVLSLDSISCDSVTTFTIEKELPSIEKQKAIHTSEHLPSLQKGQCSELTANDKVERSSCPPILLKEGCPMPILADSLSFSPMILGGTHYGGMFLPYGYGHLYGWQLHKGLNVSLDVSMFSQIGKHAYGGVGFAQNISMMYVAPLSQKMCLAVGGYYNNMYWAHSSFQDAGINATLAYRFNERWEGYLYAQKAVVKNAPIMLMDIHDLCDRIGAAVKYNFSPSFSVQMSVERRGY